MTRRSRTKLGTGLTPEDAELWRRVADSIAPLTSHGRVSGPDLSAEPTDGPAEQRIAPAREPRRDGAPAAVPGRSEVRRIRTAPTVVRAPRLPSFDRRKQRQLATGRIAIDARIDLHGMTQAEAHATLRAFLYGCSARGDRMVLVITGKGAPAAHVDAMGFDGEQRERGVLRRNVPRWLAEPDLAPLVVACGPASARHGGEGALYVQLRTRRSDRGEGDVFE